MSKKSKIAAPRNAKKPPAQPETLETQDPPPTGADEPSSAAPEEAPEAARDVPVPSLSKPAPKNNYVLVILDSCRFDSFVAANTPRMKQLGALERRYSYAAWTAPSHYNLMTGLLPHTSPPHVYASEYYKQDFYKYSERLGIEGIKFRSFVPELWFPTYLRKQGYRTHARVSLPVISQFTNINHDFNSYRLMPHHNDMKAMLGDMFFTDDRPSFWLLNVGETHYPYALPDEPENEWPRISGVHGVFKRLDESIVDGEVVVSDEQFFDEAKMEQLRRRQIDSISYIDGVMEQLFDLVPKNTYITITADHGELFGEAGYFGHGPIMHEKVFEVPFLEGKLR